MTEAAVLFKQTGASDEDAAKLAQLANLYMNVADNEMTAADASAYITSQMKAFKITANDAISILDKTNEVSNKFAVSSSDISRALTTSSASLAVYGNDINDTIALVTAGTEIMTGKAQQVGRGLRSIGANIAALASSAGELEFQVNGTTKTISLIDEETGDMINTFEALSRIHEYWDEMTASEQAALATSLAGKTQLDVFSSTLSNFNTAIEANTVAVESNGSAWEENNKRADSISTKLNLLKSQFQELVLGKGGLQEFAKNLLDVGIAILKFANSDVGKFIIQITLAYASFTLLDKALQSAKFNTIILSLKNLTLAFDAFSSGIASGTKGVAAFKLALDILKIDPVILALTAVVGVATLAYKAYDHFNVTIDEHIDKINELQDEYNSAQSEIESLEEQLKSVREQIEAINGQDELSITDKDQLALLLGEEQSLKNQLEYEKELAKIAKERSDEESKKAYNQDIKYTQFQGFDSDINFDATGTTYKSTKGTMVDALNAYNETLDQLGNKIIETRQAMDKLELKDVVTDADLDKMSQYEQTLTALEQEYDTARNKSLELVGELQSIRNGFDESNVASQEYINNIDNAIGAWSNLAEKGNELEASIQGITYVEEDGVDIESDYSDGADEAADKLKELAKQADISEEELVALADSLHTSVESIAEWLSGANDFSDSLSDLSSAYETLKEAADEYNSTGTYSAETMSQLLALHPDYISALQDENGQLVVNESALQNVANAMIDDAEATLLTKTQTEIANIIAGNFDATLVSLGTDALTTATNVETAGIKAAESGANANEGALGWLQFWNAASKGQGTVTTEEQAKAMEQLRNETQREYEALEDLRGKVGQYGKASASAHSKAAKATDSEKSAVDSLKDKYKTVIDFILKQYDKQIDKIKEAKDAAIKSVESQIKALEKEKDSKVRAIDAEITALQRERDAREKYWQDQLDKLEKENDERERNIALQEKQQALALAQQTNVMVLQDGQFQYTQDESAVAGAEQDLAQQEDQNEYERQKELIEELRDTELEWYDERIQSLEDYKEQVEEYYEEQIEQLEEYKEYLEEYYEAQIEALEAEKEAVNETLEEGAANQQEYWDTMKEQLQTFVEEWNALVGEMTFPNISGSGISLSAVGGKISASMGGKSTGDNKVSAYASGKGSIGDSEIAVVGENPKYRELVIGSKLNNDQGVVMSLKRGSGVVNAGATNTLASIFNSLNGQKSIGQAVSNNSQSMSIQIGSISLPEVKDGQGFVDYLQNFSADITQQSFRRA